MRFDIHLYFAECDGKQFDRIILIGEKILETVKTLNDKLDALATTTSAERAEWLAAVADFKAQIQALKDQIAAGTPVTQADLDALGARLDAQTAVTQAIVDKADV